MQFKSPKKTLQNISNRFLEAEKVLVSSWHSYCGCEPPGREIKCQSCPYFIEYLQEVQLTLEPNPELVFPILLPPPSKEPYSEEIKQQCLQMYSNNYSFQEISQLTEVKNLEVLRRWVNQNRLTSKKRRYSLKEKEICLQLYREGLSHLEIEAIRNVNAYKILGWAKQAGISTVKWHYSESEKEIALSMYQEGKSYSEIEEAIGMTSKTVIRLAEEAKIYNKKKAKSGRPRTYSEEIRKQCLELLKSGKTPAQIEEQMEISQSTIRYWKKQYQLNTGGLNDNTNN